MLNEFEEDVDSQTQLAQAKNGESQPLTASTTAADSPVNSQAPYTDEYLPRISPGDGVKIDTSATINHV